MKYFATFCLILALLASCKSKTSSKQTERSNRTSFDTSQYTIDTSKISILTIDAGHSVQFRYAKSVELSRTDFRLTEVLLRDCINSTNDSSQVLKVYTLPFIDINNYKRQYIPFAKPNGDRFVWVNCFCADFPFWKNKVVFVFDGGACFFNVEINLTKRAYGELYINSN